MTRAAVGIGSNLGDSAGTVREAIERLGGVGTGLVNSDFYLTEPWGVTDQPRFVNAAAVFDTRLEPGALLRDLRAIERDLGRTAGPRWGPRAVDLDILLYGDRAVTTADLVVPHPFLRKRAFALAPLADIAGDAPVPPDGRRVADLLASLPQRERERVRRLPGTAKLRAPQRVDYDDPGGAGEGYEELRPFSRFDEAVLDAVLRATGPVGGKRVLDVGCGTGRFSERLNALGARVTGLDPSETMLASARARGDGVTYARGDADRALPDGPWDAVTAFYCIQYLDASRLAANAMHVLAPGGVLAIATFPHRHFAEVEFGRFFPSLPAIDMARFPSVPALRATLARAGMTDVETRDVLDEMQDEPERLIARVAAKYLSSFHLLDAGEFEKGLDAMRWAWRGRPSVHRTARAAIVSARRPVAAR